MNDLEQTAHRLKQKLGREYDDWRSQPDHLRTTGSPDHHQQWHVVRLLMHASRHKSFNVLHASQIRSIKSYVDIGRVSIPPKPSRPQSRAYTV